MAEKDEQRSVLVIDDEVRICRVLERILAREYDVTIVNDASVGLEYLAERGWDVVLCDLRMPQISGMELYHKAVEARPELSSRFVFLSGDLTGDEIQTFLRTTGERALAKPFELDALRETVRSVFA